MNKLWFGIHNDRVVFAKSEDTLKQQGVSTPESFTVTGSGDITGIDYLDDQQVQSQQSSSQTA